MTKKETQNIQHFYAGNAKQFSSMPGDFAYTLIVSCNSANPAQYDDEGAIRGFLIEAGNVALLVNHSPSEYELLLLKLIFRMAKKCETVVSLTAEVFARELGLPYKSESEKDTARRLLIETLKELSELKFTVLHSPTLEKKNAIKLAGWIPPATVESEVTMDQLRKDFDNIQRYGFSSTVRQFDLLIHPQLYQAIHELPYYPEQVATKIVELLRGTLRAVTLRLLSILSRKFTMDKRPKACMITIDQIINELNNLIRSHDYWKSKRKSYYNNSSSLIFEAVQFLAQWGYMDYYWANEFNKRVDETEAKELARKELTFRKLRLKFSIEHFPAIEEADSTTTRKRQSKRLPVNLRA